MPATATATPRARLLGEKFSRPRVTAAHASVDDARDACARVRLDGDGATLRRRPVARARARHER